MRTPRKPSLECDLQRLLRRPREVPLYGAPPACRVFHSADQTLTTGVGTTLAFNSERWDTDTMHFTSAANLTGTVAKGAGGTALVGTGTLFTSELSVGQMISVPGGGGTEIAVVTSIGTDTTATVAVGGSGGVWAFTASGQTAARVNTGLVANTPGLYAIFAHVRFATNPTGRRQANIALNAVTAIGSQVEAASPASVTDLAVGTQYRLQQWDFLILNALQDSGGNLNVSSAGNVSPEFGMSRVGPA